MESIILIYFCLLLLSIVSNAVGRDSLVDTLNEMAIKKERINNILTPLPDGFLGRLTYSTTYKGLLLPTNKEVAMKFRSIMLGHNEYDMYTYLNAINKPDVEAYGVPAIHYYDIWENYTVMAMTLFDPEFHTCNQYFEKNDILIIFREFVRVSKYIHSRGLFQQYNIGQLQSMRFCKDQGFIYDFYYAKKFSNGTREEKLSAAREDWKAFFRDMYSLFVKNGLLPILFRLRAMENSASFSLWLLEHSKMKKPHCGLRRVLIEFAKRANGNDGTNAISFYDQLYGVIIEEIGKLKPAVPLWLSKEPDRATTSKNARNKISSISKIRDPFASNTPKYDTVNYGCFVEVYREYYEQIDKPGFFDFAYLLKQK